MLWKKVYFQVFMCYVFLIFALFFKVNLWTKIAILSQIWDHIFKTVFVLFFLYFFLFFSFLGMHCLWQLLKGFNEYKITQGSQSQEFWIDSNFLSFFHRITRFVGEKMSPTIRSTSNTLNVRPNLHRVCGVSRRHLQALGMSGW